ncbi:hypothetical protein A9K97_gp292 [Tokyovirus A1]|uniref:hypothetical protein n=1 Tax=Tokyovirus A1 TaxID=1826170 RepID=UPI0007A97D5C|nr:hypothetical protein A9K97_gp292 [Tokyovirus A1]BAU80059.1 hypothetical protein [Tokyovirus A1]
MQSLILEAMRHSLRVSSRPRKNIGRLRKCLELMSAIEAKIPKAEQRYAFCRYNETLYEETHDNVATELKRMVGFAPDWSFTSQMGIFHEGYEEIIGELSETNAIWWETEEASHITFLPPRPLLEGDLKVRLVCGEQGYTIVDADGDETPCDKEDAVLCLSAACEKRKGGYPILSACLERVESML